MRRFASPSKESNCLRSLSQSLASKLYFDCSERVLTYGDVFHQNEVEHSHYNFEASDPEKLFKQFDYFEGEAKRLMEAQLALPAYEMVLKAGHTFNLLDARGAISVTERAAYISRIRKFSREVAQSYYDSRERMGFPMCQGAKAQ